jgi:redox-sensing transcriptional repressor
MNVLPGALPREVEVTSGLSTASLRRLPQYLRLLTQLLEDGQQYVTSAELARRLKLDETLVRKDIALTGFTGKPRMGFEVQSLRQHLEDFLGLHCAKEAFIIGAGHLGQALASYKGFAKYGLRIIGLFDTDPEKVGTVVCGLEVQPLWKASALARRQNIRIAILTVPPESAQAVADLLADAGIHAFWNFSGHPIQMPAPVIVLNEDLADSLAVLSHRLSEQMTS